jgi:hypothetical protein
MKFNSILTSLVIISLAICLSAIIITDTPKKFRDHTNEKNVIYPTDGLENTANVLPYGGTTPSPRVFSSTAVVSNFFIVFGGYTTDGEPMDDINMYDMDSHMWSGPILKRKCCDVDNEVIETLGSDPDIMQEAPQIRQGFEGDLPAARAEHIACTVGDVGNALGNSLMYVFGGYTSYFQYVQDLYTFDPVQLNWKKISKTTGGLPSRRAGHSAVGFSDGFYVFGGRTTGDTGLNDVWMYDYRINKWELLETKSTNVPIPRQHTAMSIVNQKIFIFGGIIPSTKVILDDFWSFDMASRVWTCHSVLGSSAIGFGPPPLYRSHLISINPNGLLVYGGFGGGGSCGGAVCNSLESTLGQTYVFRFDQKKWLSSKLYTSTTRAEEEYVTNTMWQYSRMTTGGTYKGRLRKLFAFEEVFFVPSRNMLFEFGGLQAVDYSLATADQTATGLNPGEPVGLDSGKRLPDVAWDKRFQWNMDQQKNDFVGLVHPQGSVLWNLETAEHDRSVVDLPTNGYWEFFDAFTQAQPQLNFTKVRFHNCLRYYSIQDGNMIHIHTVFDKEMS